MSVTEFEQDLFKRLSMQGDLFTVNRNRELTEQVNQQVVTELQREDRCLQGGSSENIGKKRTRSRRAKLSDYSYYLQTIEKNEFPMEMLPENTRFKKTKQMILRVMNLVFQWQQLFNKATKDVLFLVIKDMKNINMRQQGLEDKLDIQVLDLLERQDEEIRSLKALIAQLQEKQTMLEAEIARYKAKNVEQGKDAK